MRILALSSWWPEPADNGARLRISHLLRALAHQHEVHLIAFAQGAVSETDRVRMEEVCASARAVPMATWTPRRVDVVASLWHAEPASVRATWNPAFDTLVRKCAAGVKPDLVIAFQLGVAPYARSVAGIPRILEEVEVTRFLDHYLGEHDPRRRLRAWLTWYKQRNYVARLLRDFDACSVVSAREQACLHTFAPDAIPVAIIPNGADVAGCAQNWDDPEPDTLIYPGALSYDANMDAMVHFLSTIFPSIKAARPHVRLRITGKADPAQRAALPLVDGVELTGYVPDVRPVVARSWVEVVPLRTGGGSRLKVLEALALGTPIVSTPKGIEGLDLVHNQHVLVADSPVDFAAATLAILQQPDLRKKLTTAGHQIVRERYDWSVIGQQLLDVVVKTVAKKGNQTHAYHVA